MSGVIIRVNNSHGQSVLSDLTWASSAHGLRSKQRVDGRDAPENSSLQSSMNLRNLGKYLQVVKTQLEHLKPFPKEKSLRGHQGLFLGLRDD